MRSGPSTTAQMMAFIRAVADVGGTAVLDFHDPTAEHLLSLRWSLGLAVMRRALHHPGVRRRFVTTAARGLDGIALRTRAIDAAWSEARPGSQLVILGAGLDGRAWRLPGLQRVFEVDHPATQHYKRRKAADLPAPPVDLRWVAVDLVHDDLGDALRRMGFDAALPSFWIWEGVIPYLAKSTTETVLRSIASCAAPGSRLAATYIQPPSTTSTARMLEPVRRIFGRLGEPFLGLIHTEELATALQSAGFAVVSDTGVQDWAHRFREETASPTQDVGERLAVAERRTM